MAKKERASSAVSWHALEVDEVFARLNASADGLSKTEAENRLSTYGPNRLRAQKKRSPLLVFFHQFRNVLIYVLLSSAAVTALLGHWVDAGVIMGVVLINGLIGFVQEGKAERALDAIRHLISPQASVIRNGIRISVPSEQLVPGDVVFVESGDKVSADIRLIRIKGLFIDEAPLTGESAPVEKSIRAVAEQASLGDRTDMAFSGTMVTSGQGIGVVVATGNATELGRISDLIYLTPILTTRLMLRMAEFGRTLTAGVIGLAVLTVAFGILIRDYGFGELFLAAVGLAVAAIPEGLPAILSITLAIGVQRMARRNAIIRRLPSVETLGSVTVICSDKTGTLTLGEMTVKTVCTVESLYEVSGSGYEPEGSCMIQGKEVSCQDNPQLSELARAAALCNDASLHRDNGRWQLEGDPTEGALLVFAMKAGFDPHTVHEQSPRTDVIPFESEHRFMATLHQEATGEGGVLYLKGAPERVLEMCRYQHVEGKDVSIEKAYWFANMDQMANRGQRLLAMAMKKPAPDHRQLRSDDVQGGLSLLGLFGILDPPRGDAIDAVRQCRTAGIRVKMITGDHAMTARAIGAQMGIGEGTVALTGQDMEEINGDELRWLVRSVDVFARVSPEHKLQIVEALQANNEVVAMTGDGVNDAPALKRADIGVAMGRKGTEVAKEAAEMVLTDDNFASIAHAVEQGRAIYDNIKKAIMFILPTNAGEAGIIVAAIVFGRTLPITPVQILWINMITAVTLALSLAFEPPESDVMRRPPRDPQEPILSYFLIWRILFVSTVILVGTFGLFLWERLHGAGIDAARTVAVNSLVAFEIFYLLNARFIRESVFTWDGIFGSSYTILAIFLVMCFQLLFTYSSPMQRLFGTDPVSSAAWMRIVIVAATAFLLVEAEKYVLRRRRILQPRPADI